MAPIKRKTTSEIDTIRPTKKPKPTKPVSGPPALRQEEPSFPRGGASVLTPLEQKQIQVQAKNDVLFEQETGRKAPKNDFVDEEDEPDPISQSELHSSKAKRRSKQKSKLNTPRLDSKEKGIRIEGLSYKRLIPGSMVLGLVSQINRYDVALSLPNNLTGYLPITSVSDSLTARVERLAEDNLEDDDGTQEQEIDLQSFFFIGQYLRAFVVSTERDAAAGMKGKRHIELSVNPRQANSSLKRIDIVVNSMVQASVRSVEDHGLIMELGMEGDGVRGFMSSKEIGRNTDISHVQQGTVFLCLVTGFGSNGNVVKLSADTEKAGNLKKGHFLIDAPTIDCFLPGTAVEILVSEVTKAGILGTAMGVLNLTADLVHSGTAASGKDLETKYHVGDRIKGRIICTFPDSEPSKIGFSLLEHVTSLKSNPTSSKLDSEDTSPTSVLPLSTIVPEARIARVEPGVGLLVDMGVIGIRGFVHISRIADGKVENIAQDAGPYKVGTVHKARVIGYNYLDGLFIVSLEPKVIAQPFLSVDDVRVGQIVKGTIEKLLIKESGVSGIIVNLAEGVTGLVPEIHFADIHLQYPERKFKEGASVTARVLSTSPAERQLRLTLKKTLVNSEQIWKSYDDLEVGAEAPGTIIKIISSRGAGAVIQFFGSVRGFLPVSEMSESYIDDPEEHFRLGQVVKIRLISVDPAQKRMIVSCKDPSIAGAAQQEQLERIVIGSTVNGTVSEKANDEIILELEGTNLKAILPFEHLTDGSAQKSSTAAKKIRVGQIMKDMVVLSKAEGKRLLQLTSKPSLMKAAQSGKLVKHLDDLQEGKEVDGFVNNSTSAGVFVRFANSVSGLLPKSHLPESTLLLPNFGMRKHQSISARVLSVDYAQNRFSLTTKTTTPAEAAKPYNASVLPEGSLSHPVDEVSTNINDFNVGKLTKARISSIKETQLNVQLADGVQGRIDASEVFDSLEDIKDRKHPLKQFHPKQVLPVRILGMHDSRNHRFLPITHRSKAPVFELTAKPSNMASTDLEILTLDKVKVDSMYLAHVNNVAEDCVWVNLSPNVRGRIRALELSDDVSLLKDLGKNFPVGSALKAKVVNINVANNRLDLSSRSGTSTKPLTIGDLSVGMVLPGRVTRVNERQIMVQLTDSLSGPVNLVDLADDYSTANPTIYEKNQIVRVCIRGVDIPNKRIYLSTRPSKTLSSSLPVEDREINTVSDLKVNDVVRGFVKNIADNGVFISLAFNVTAFVRISDLSDLFLKDWKSEFEIDQLVKGRVIQVDLDLNLVQMSLKRSHVDKDYRPPLTFDDIIVGQVVTGKVRKVEDFGVFIVIDNSANVSGLCHKSQMADRKSLDPKKLYNEGDLVKAKVLKIDRDTRRISLGLKASFFEIEVDVEDAEDGAIERSVMRDDLDEDSEVERLQDMLAKNDDEAAEGREVLEETNHDQSDLDMRRSDDGGVDLNGGLSQESRMHGLAAGGFDWTGGIMVAENEASESETDAEAPLPKKKKRRKAEPQSDLTGNLDVHGPQSVADFERLLLGKPNRSALWVQYMAFQLQLSEIDKAREIAERALRTIHIREQDEKLNVWMALLNLENAYGTDEALDNVFARACQHCDGLDIHERLASTFIQSGRYEKAETLYTKALSKYGSTSDAVWLNVATFYITTLNQPSKAHALLPRALQSLPQHTHIQLTSQFAALEFKSPNGDPERGRTMFEGILGSFPKRWDIYSRMVDLETNKGEKERARGLFERVTRAKGVKAGKMKKWFEKWEKWEGQHGDERSRGRVLKLAEAYVRKVAGEKGMVVDFVEEEKAPESEEKDSLVSA
ncbi:MAG: hypothetical protein Q9209_006365 [Squamulea sp. 1 TL-2023]